jgi:putative acetyltransferase
MQSSKSKSVTVLPCAEFLSQSWHSALFRSYCLDGILGAIVPNTMIRSAKPQDIEAIYGIYTDSTVNPYMTYPVMEKDAFEPIFRELEMRDEFLAFELNGETIGFCTLSKGKGRTQHKVMIKSLGLKESHQGHGNGTKFLKALLQHLRGQGFKRVELIVEGDNERAIGFYQKMGFEIEGKLRSYFKRENQAYYIDDLYMAIVWDR